MTITALPTPPKRTDDPDTFIARSDTFIAALPQFATDVNAAQADITLKATQAVGATDAMNTAVAAANTAQATAGATAWMSGQTYALNSVAISPSNRQSYRRIVAGAGTTEPAGDLTNWTLLFGNDANGAFLPYAMTTTTIDLSKGNFFTHTVNGAVTYNIINCPSPGYSFTLEVNMVSGSAAFPAAVKTPGNAVPNLSVGKSHLFMLVTSNTGARWRMTVAPNYDT